MPKKTPSSLLCVAFPLPEEGATGFLTVDLVLVVLVSKSQRESGLHVTQVEDNKGQRQSFLKSPRFKIMC